MKRTYIVITILLSILLLSGCGKNAEKGMSAAEKAVKEGNYEKAMKIYAKLCDNGVAEACAKKEALFKGDGNIANKENKPDKKEQKEIKLSKEDENKSDKASKPDEKKQKEIKLLLEKADNEWWDHDKAIKIYTELCDKSVAEACVNKDIRLSMKEARKAENENNYEKAMKIYTEFCDKEKVARACIGAADVYYYLHQTPEIKERLSESHIYYEPYVKKAYDIYKSECDNGNAKSCYEGAILYYSFDPIQSAILSDYSIEDKNYLDKALPLFEKGCAENNPSACVYSGDIYINGKKDKTKAAPFYDKALSHFEKECSGGKAFACVQTGDIYINGKEDKIKASAFYDKACKLGNDLGCFNLKSIK